MFITSPAFRHLAMAVTVTASLLAAPAKSLAQNQVFFEDWETNHNADGAYIVNAITNAGAGGAIADFYYDYSTLGIPLSPHSLTTNTHALKLVAGFATNSPATTTETFPTGLSVSPKSFGITDNFEMRWDQWYNFNGPAPGGGSGSTIVGGGGYGTFGTNAEVAGNALDAIAIGDTMDGGSSADFRVYSFTHSASYQDGDFQLGSDGQAQTTHGDPTSGFVYAGGGSRNNTGSTYYTTNFPGKPIPPAEATFFPQQTGTAANGTFSFAWHEVALAKIANVITYKVDGILIASVNVVDAGTSGGSNIFWEQFDISASASTDPNFTNLNFMLVDNVRITNFANVVSVSTTNTAIFEGNNTAGIFTVTRTASGTPLTVNYTMTGSASNGVDYVDASGNPLSGSVTFAPNATSTNISVFAVDDSIPELTENIIFNVNNSTNYTGAGNATIFLVDNDKPLLTITNVDTQMFKKTNDFARFQVSRLGSTNVASFPINLSFSGTAALGVDFTTNVIVTFEPGISTTNITIFPVEDTTYKGNQTVTVSIAPASGGEYTVGTNNSASVNIISALNPTETVLFSDNFDTDSSTNWTVLSAAFDGVSDNEAFFAFDYSGLDIPPSPNGNGSTLGLFLTVNKLDTDASASVVNLYPKSQSFSGNYALRFDMWQNIAPKLTTTTEYVLAGLNASGTKTNWWRSGGVPAGWTFDGVWYTLETDAQASPNFVNYSSPITTNNNPTQLTAGTNSSGFTQIFKSPPWAVAGSPAATDLATSGTAAQAPWSEVELSQIGNIQTLRINNSTILTYSNATPYQAGNILVGYLDAFDSIGDINTYAVIDNVRVVRLNGLLVSGVQIVGTNAVVNFSFDLADAPSSFTLVGSSSVNGPFTAETSGTITRVSTTQYKATVPIIAGGSQFFLIKHN